MCDIFYDDKKGKRLRLSFPAEFEPVIDEDGQPHLLVSGLSASIWGLSKSRAQTAPSRPGTPCCSIWILRWSQTCEIKYGKSHCRPGRWTALVSGRKISPTGLVGVKKEGMVRLGWWKSGPDGFANWPYFCSVFFGFQVSGVRCQSWYPDPDTWHLTPDTSINGMILEHK